MLLINHLKYLLLDIQRWFNHYLHLELLQIQVKKLMLHLYKLDLKYKFIWINQVMTLFYQQLLFVLVVIITMNKKNKLLYDILFDIWFQFHFIFKWSIQIKNMSITKFASRLFLIFSLMMKIKKNVFLSYQFMIIISLIDSVSLLLNLLRVVQILILEILIIVLVIIQFMVLLLNRIFFLI